MCFAHDPETVGRRELGQKKRKIRRLDLLDAKLPHESGDMSLDALVSTLAELRAQARNAKNATAIATVVGKLEMVQEARKQTKSESVRVLTIEYVNDWRGNADTVNAE
jgi:hypothetical protein